LRHGFEKIEKLLYASHLQRGVNSVADADEGEGASIFVVGDVGTDQRADSRGVDIRDGGEIKNQSARFLGTNGGLKPEQCSEHDGTLEPENSLARREIIELVDGKRFL